MKIRLRDNEKHDSYTRSRCERNSDQLINFIKSTNVLEQLSNQEQKERGNKRQFVIL